MQALVLLHQTVLEHEWSTRLQLNGSEISLGTLKDVLDKVYGRRAFAIGLHEQFFRVEWEFGGIDDKQAMSVPVECVTIDSRRSEQPAKLRHLLPETSHDAARDLAKRLLRLTNLTAERVGPRDVYDLQDPSTVQVVGPRGENAVGMLYQRRDQEVHPNLVLATEPPTLLKQVQARMNAFFPGTSLVVQQVPQANMVTLGLRTSAATDFHRPVHVGFGLTQVLPIVVAALTAKDWDLLLIENPEVHLHPAGQALMGEFLTEIADAGVQVLVETHSDHLLNGIRRGVKSGRIAASDVALHFFRTRDAGSAQVTSPNIDQSGNIGAWPPGFFDQFDKDLNYFAGWEA
ncbi:MAG: DUF3696 domain-containing protein [Planctomycetota bacterium]|nr:DUF3696 domain-containing protein [Planctomycetota bacterium]